MHPVGPYRNESCRALAEKVARADAERTLDITINIDQMLQGSRAGIAKEVLEALTAGQPFVLYTETERYCMVLPGSLTIINIIGDTEHSRSVGANAKEFANNLRLAIATYTKFFAMQTRIEAPDKNILALSE